MRDDITAFGGDPSNVTGEVASRAFGDFEVPAEMLITASNATKRGPGFVYQFARDRQLASEIAGAWVQFAKTRTSNGASLPEWPAYLAHAASRQRPVISD